MHPSDQGQSRAKRRFPNWLKIILAVFAVLFLLGAIFGKAPEEHPTAAPAAPTSDSTTTTTTPAPVTYTVASVTDAANFDVVANDGKRRTVHVQDVTTTGAAGDCFGAETVAWAGTKLIGTVVRLGADSASGVTVALADGQDYATLAVSNGYLKATGSALAAAETAARQAVKGFWGPPCNGSITLAEPAPQPDPQPTSAPPAPATKAAPKPPRTTVADPPAPKPDKSVYYKNCAEAKAAGVTPIHRGQPGYRSGLDRDGDGTACDKE
ncbi:excalibur calcium-binding domain-containing protein [Amycolatopsis mongoliensis]|uniref:Excalibur calcium-binding domain-containing protein n=1 Tax=Amycolatopsis mongoliensis TaxID=715475 RepID=A0A9Y2NJQ9_9PSEU|nr:excalibur calcium-binding domain-containing protein [Amycolatopsis sp. 4-36]WIY04259.1 excalibur calcium-binding domain-containing protein [Amycolatopsis sp. 4-36]